MTVHGVAMPGFERVAATFIDVVESGGGPAQFCLMQHGRTVVDLWAGVDPDALVHVWSATKPFAALGVLRLVASGRAGIDDRVVDHWPAYGDTTTTVRHVLSHQAGRPAWPPGTTVADVIDRERSLRIIETMQPEWAPGEAVGEHALTYGHLCAGVVHAVTGESLGALLRREVCEPLGIDMHIGVLPADLARCVDLIGLDPAWAALACSTRQFERVLTSPPGLLDTEAVNSVAWRQAEVAAVNGHASARGLAKFYRLILEADPGLLPGALLAEARRPQAVGVDQVLERDVRWGLMGQLYDEPQGSFGMGGIGGTVAFGDPLHGLAFAFVPVRMGGFERAEALERAALAAVTV
jgi:CubicO group peptidase (beta-lactamase class C family)